MGNLNSFRKRAACILALLFCTAGMICCSAAQADVAGAGGIEEKILSDNGLFQMLITSDDADLSDGYTWNIVFKNGDRTDYAVSINETSINGIMCETDEWGVSGWTLKGGSEISTSLTWTEDELDAAGITQIQRISFHLRVFDSSTLSDSSVPACIDTLYTLDVKSEQTEDLTESGLLSEAEDAFPTEAFYEGEEAQTMADNDIYTFRVLSFELDGDGVPVWRVYIENHTENTLMFELNNAVINGWAITPYWSQTVLPGDKAYSLISWWDMDIDVQEITQIDNGSFEILAWKEEQGWNPSYELMAVSAVSIEPSDKSSDTAAGSEKRQENAGDLVLWDTEDGQMVLTDTFFSAEKNLFELSVFLLNEGSEDLSFSIYDMKLDDYRTNVSWNCDLPPASRKSSVVRADISTMDKKKMPEKIELGVMISDIDNTISDQTLCISLKDHTVTEVQPEESVSPEEETEMQSEAAGEEMPEEQTEGLEEGLTEAQTEVMEEERAEEQTEGLEEGLTEAQTESMEEETAEEQTEGLEEGLTEAQTEAAEDTAEAETEVPEESMTEEEALSVEDMTEAAGQQKVYEDVDTVRNLLAALRSAGYETETSDGTISDALREQIADYRTKAGLPEGDMIDDDLLFSLGVADARTYQKVQQKLNDIGFDCGEPDGLIGEKTRKAIADFREAYRLGSGDGIDRDLLKELGIDTAE